MTIIRSTDPVFSVIQGPKRKLGCLLSVGMSLLIGCATGPDYERPEDRAPKAWEGLPSHSDQSESSKLKSSTIAASTETDWWKRFNDPMLTHLIERALQENLSLQEASTVLAQSRALRTAAGADQFPMINGNASYTRLAPSQNGILSLANTLVQGGTVGTSSGGSGSGGSASGQGIGVVKFPSSGIQPFNLYQYGFDASWEVDLWGRVRREMESAEASVEASRAAHHGSQLSVIAEVARNYIELRRLQASLGLAEQRKRAAHELVDITAHQERRGIVTENEVEAARSAYSTIEAELPELRRLITASINQISLLLGQKPGALNAELEKVKPIPEIPTKVRMGLPSELATRRPDIREAEASLHAALAEIGQATAEFYPRITLSGSAGFQSLRLQDLGNWSSLQYAMGPSITLPIFQGGRLQATLELRQAEHQQAAVNYHNTVIRAWHEIDNALAAFSESQRREVAWSNAAKSNKNSHTLTEQRFHAGIENYQPVLEAKVNYLRAEQTRIDGEAAVALNLVVLYKSIGGGWQPAQEQIPNDDPESTGVGR